MMIMTTYMALSKKSLCRVFVEHLPKCVFMSSMNTACGGPVNNIQTHSV